MLKFYDFEKHFIKNSSNIVKEAYTKILYGMYILGTEINEEYKELAINMVKNIDYSVEFNSLVKELSQIGKDDFEKISSVFKDKDTKFAVIVDLMILSNLSDNINEFTSNYIVMIAQNLDINQNDLDKVIEFVSAIMKKDKNAINKVFENKNQKNIDRLDSFINYLKNLDLNQEIQIIKYSPHYHFDIDVNSKRYSSESQAMREAKERFINRAYAKKERALSSMESDTIDAYQKYCYYSENEENIYYQYTKAIQSRINTIISEASKQEIELNQTFLNNIVKNIIDIVPITETYELKNRERISEYNCYPYISEASFYLDCNVNVDEIWKDSKRGLFGEKDIYEYMYNSMDAYFDFQKDINDIGNSYSGVIYSYINSKVNTFSNKSQEIYLENIKKVISDLNKQIEQEKRSIKIEPINKSLKKYLECIDYTSINIK